MKAFRRLRAVLSAQIDGVVDKLENHSEIAEAALREAKRSEARARIRLQKVLQDGERLEAQREEAVDAIATWTRRAKEIASTDQSVALECLKRKKEQELRARQVTREIEKHSRLEVQLRDRVELVSNRLKELQMRMNVIRTREHCTEVLSHDSDRHDAVRELAEMLERWDERISESEILFEVEDIPGDALEAQFNAKEATAELKAELEALISAEQ